ncbi:S41 family peptidase [uncultured Clostridium sp.]|uniref:S41 family peptidase n=1 Tax=uncultured Clostridium sp. TaxID=59620 RepID=UPI002634E89E|nr:S41 family peptidase [uncultured Clostridium sp.]
MRQRWVKRIGIGVAGIAIAGSCFYLGNKAATKGFVFGEINSKVKNAMREANTTAKYSELFDIRNAILANFDGEVPDEDLLEGAKKGMTNALKDPYTIYMTEEEYKKYNEQNSGEYVGIGIYIGVKDGQIEVVKPLENSPAKKDGILAGDILVKVDGQAIEGDIEKAGTLIKGKANEEVELEIYRPKNDEILNFKIKRAPIETEDVVSEMLGSDIGYIQIASFNQGVTKDLQEDIKSLKSEGMKGLILDLRGNPGGYLHEAVGVASQFIEKGKDITYTINKYDKKSVEVSKGGEAIGMPLVVLIDGGSASASEVVTGALRDYKVATIVGTNSFGKGIVQAPVEFEDGSALKVTVSKYYTPNGENIHKKGIAPDIEIEAVEKEVNATYSKEKDAQLNKAIEAMKEKIN